MLSFCRTLHTLLGFPDPGADDGRWSSPRHRCRNIPPAYGGGLRILVGDSPRPPNVLVSSAIGRPPERVDPGSRGLHEFDYGGGLRLLTEGLGSESCDGGMEVEEMAGREEAWGWSGRPRRRRVEARKRPPPPPPLPWLVARQTRLMWAVREVGRFRLVEVPFERPEILRAYRADGRLRLDLVVRCDRGEDDGDVALGQEEQAEATAMTEEVEEEQVDDDEEEEEEEIGEVEEEVEVGAPALSPENVVIPTRKGEERRCQEMVSGNGVPMWWNHRPMMTA